MVDQWLKVHTLQVVKKNNNQKTRNTQKLVLFPNLFASRFYSNANTNSGTRHVVFAPDNQINNVYVNLKTTLKLIGVYMKP